MTVRRTQPLRNKVDEAERNAGPDAVQSVVLTLGVLEALAGSELPRGVTELAAELGTTKARIYRHLRTLLGSGYVLQDAQTERYRAGPRLRLLGRSFAARLDLVEGARPIMRNLWQALGHTVSLSRVGLDGVRVIDVLPGKSMIEVTVKIGSFLPLHCTAQGKLALAFGDEALASNVFAAPLPELTRTTITDPRRLRKEIETVRERGWATMPDEALTGINALAAPVFGANGELLGTLAILDSIERIGRTPTRVQIRHVVGSAKEISSLLLEAP
jgi:IclR family KDG regulon transcriptional repressor